MKRLLHFSLNSFSLAQDPNDNSMPVILIGLFLYKNSCIIIIIIIIVIIIINSSGRSFDMS